MEITKTFAENLRKEREAAGLSGESLGALCKVTGKHIYDIEKGRKKASIGLMESVSEALRVPLADFFKSEEILRRPEPVSKFLKKISNVPDDIFDLAENVSLDDEAWDTVRSALEIARDRAEKKKVSNK